MKLFGSRHRRRPDQPVALASVPAGSGTAAAPVRLSDPIAQAARVCESGSRDAVWLGGVVFRADR